MSEGSFNEENQPDHAVQRAHLEPSENGSFRVRLIDESKPRKINESAPVISINGTYIRGMSREDVLQLWNSPSHGELKLEIIDIWRVLIRLIVKRADSPQLQNTSSFSDGLRASLELIDTSVDENPETFLHGLYRCEANCLEPLASAFAATAISKADQWFNTNASKRIRIQLASYFDRVGRLPEAGRAIEQTMDYVETLTNISSAEEGSLLRFAGHLRETKRSHLAEQVYLKVLECSERTIDPGPRKLRILEIFAEFLREQNAVKPTETVCGQILSLSPNHNSLLAWEIAADGYARIGLHEKAAAAYEAFADHAEREWSETQRHFDMDKPLVNAIYKWACFEESAGNLSSAIKVLERARSIYETRFDELGQLNLERIPSVLPTISDIEIKLGEVLFKNSQLHEAKVMLQAASARLEKALGSTSSLLRRPLQALALMHSALGETELEEQVRQTIATLQNGATTPDTKSAIGYQLQAFIHDNFKSNSEIAVSALEDLVTLLEEQSKVEPEILVKHRYLNAFCELLMDTQNFEKGERIFERLREILKTRPSQSGLTLTLCTERAIFAKQLKLEESECWDELERNLQFCDDLKSKAPGPKLSGSEKLRRWALAYSTRGDFPRAHAILQKALSRERDGAPDLVSNWLDEDTINLYIDLAQLELSYPQSELAPIDLNPILLNWQQISKATGWKLLHLSKQLLTKGRLSDARSIVMKVLERERARPFGPQALTKNLSTRYESLLADIHLAEGDSASSAEILDQLKVSTQSGNYPREYSTFAPEVCEKNHDYAEAARHYLILDEIATRVEPRDVSTHLELLYRALSASEKTEDLRADEIVSIFRRLGDCLSHRNKADARKMYQRALAIDGIDSEEATQIRHQLSHLAPTAEEMRSAQLEEAVRAESDGDKSSYYLWLQLALTELKLEKADEAISHLERALSTFAKSKSARSNFRPLLANSQLSNVTLLVAQKREADAERLLKLAIEACEKVFGAGSPQASISTAELATFYANVGQFREIIPLTESIIENYSEMDAFSSGGMRPHIAEAVRRLLSVAENLPEEYLVDIAAEIGLLILNVQRATLPPENLQIQKTLLALGSVYARASQYATAESFYAEALKIGKLHDGNGRFAITLMEEYAQVLRALGRNSDADDLLTFKTIGIKRREPRYFHDLQMKVAQHESRKEFDEASRLIDEAMELAAKEGLQEHSTMSFLEQSADFYLRIKDYEKAQQILTILLKIFKSGVSTQPEQWKGCNLSLASIFAAQGARDSALKHLRQAQQIEFDGDEVTRFFFKYAKLEIELELFDDVRSRLETIEHKLIDDANETTEESHKTRNSRKVGLAHYWGQVSDLWEKIGEPERAGTARNNSKAHRISRQSPKHI